MIIMTQTYWVIIKIIKPIRLAKRVRERERERENNELF